jgi:hypothetical protein
MASIVIAGDTSGTCTISAPAVAGTPTLTLPTTSGTILTSASTGISASNITTGTLPFAQLPTGSVLQVVQSTQSASTSTTSSSFVATGLTASITPKYSTSKILIQISGNLDADAASTQITYNIYRNSTGLAPATGFGLLYSTGGRMQAPLGLVYLDSPATTSSTSYTFYIARALGSGTAIFNNGSNIGTNTANIVLMEIAG